MPVEQELRDRLAEQLSALIHGKITNDDFDDELSTWLRSSDAGIRAVAEFAWSLYSDVSTHTLTGKHALKPEATEYAERAILFLRAGINYGWPEHSSPPWPLKYVATYFFLGSLMLFTAFLRGDTVGLLVGMLGSCFLVPVAHWACTFEDKMQRHRQFRATGDFAVWPFLRRADYDAAVGSTNA